MSKNILGYKSTSIIENETFSTKSIIYETTALKINDFDNISDLMDAIRSEINANDNLNTLKNQCFSNDNFIDIENYPWYKHYVSVYLVLTKVVTEIVPSDFSENMDLFDNPTQFRENIIGDNGVKLLKTFKEAQGYTFLCSWYDQRFDIWDLCVGTSHRKNHIATNLLNESMAFVSRMIRDYIPSTKDLFNRVFPKPHLFNSDTYNFEENKITIEVIAQKYNLPALRSLYNAGFRVNSQSFEMVDNIPALKPLYPDYINKEGKIYVHLLYEFKYKIDEETIILPDGSTFQGLQLGDIVIKDIANSTKDEIESEYYSLTERLNIMDSGSRELRKCRVIINPDSIALFKAFLEFPVEIGFFLDYSVERGSDSEPILFKVKKVDLKTIDVANENQIIANREGGCVVSIGKTSGLFVFHTHPYTCCSKGGYNLAAPSDADLNIITLGNILKFGLNNFSTGIIASHEGVYLYSIHQELQESIIELKKYLCTIPGYNNQQFEMVILLITNFIHLGGRLSMWNHTIKYKTVDKRNDGLHAYLKEMRENTLNNILKAVNENENLIRLNKTNGPVPYDSGYNYKLSPEVLFKEQPGLLTIFYNLLSKFNEFNANDYNIHPENGDRIDEKSIFGQNISYGYGAFRELNYGILNSFLKYFAYTSIFISPQTFSADQKRTILRTINELYDKIIDSKIWNIELWEYGNIDHRIEYDFYTNHYNVRFECNNQTKEYINNIKDDPILKNV